MHNSASRPRRWMRGAAGALRAVGSLATAPRPAHAARLEAEGGNLVVTIEPTENVADGQAVSVRVEARNGATINQVDANQCIGPTQNEYEWNGDGGLCAESKLSPAHDFLAAVHQAGPFPPGTAATAEFTYHVGRGQQDVDDLFGTVQHLDCILTCSFNLYIQYSGRPDVQVAVPLSFRDGPPDPPGQGETGGAGTAADGSAGAASTGTTSPDE